MITAGGNEESVVGVRCEQFFHPVEVEPERKENFHIRSFGEDGFVELLGTSQIAHADRIRSGHVTDGIQRV